MSRYDDENEDDDHGHSSSGRGSHSSSRERYGHTSDFSTTLISEDGRFLGVKLDPEMVKKARQLFPVIQTWLTDRGERLATQHFNPEVGKAVGYGIALIQPITEVGQNLYDSAQRLKQLHTATKPLTSTGNTSAAPLSGNNEVIANARGKINGMFWQSIVETGVGTVSALPSLLFHMNKMHERHQKEDLLRNFDKAKGNLDKQVELVEKELTLGGGSKTNLSASDMRAVQEKIVANRRKAYQEKFENFKKEKKSTIESDLKKTLRTITEEDIQYNRDALERKGFYVDQVSEDLKGRRGKNGKWEKVKPKEALEKFIQANQKGKLLDSRIDKEVKRRFVSQEGAFDDTWLEYLGEHRSRSGNTPATHKEEIEQELKKLREAHLKTKEQEHTQGGEHDKKFSEIMEGAKGLLAGLGGSFLRETFGGKTKAEYEKPIALDRILHLRRVMEEGGDNPPETVSTDPKSKTNEKDMGYVQYVHKIFQQHQKDCKRADIGERFFEHFEKARWNDESIQKLPDDQLTTYEYAVKTIAQRIQNGRMDTIALIALVGDKQKKIVRDDGRSFGPAGVGKDEAAVKEAIKKIIDEKTATLHSAMAQTDEQINSKLGDFVFSIEDLKNALDSKTLDQQQRAFIFTVFSDVVGSGDKLCQKVGIPAERCEELRKECKVNFNKMLDSAVIVLAEMIENEPETLKKLKEQKLELNDEQKEMITSLAQQVKEKGKDVADAAGKNVKDLETTVANVAMALSKEPGTPGEDGKAQNFWQRLVAATKRPKKAPEKEESSHKRHNKSDKKSNGSMHDEENEAYAKGNDFSAKDDEEMDFGEETSHRSKHTKKSHAAPKRDNFLDDMDEKPVSMQDRVNKHRRKPPHENRELV